MSNKNCCSQRTIARTVPGHSALKFKQIEKIKKPLVSENIYYPRADLARVAVFVSSRIVAASIEGNVVEPKKKPSLNFVSYLFLTAPAWSRSKFPDCVLRTAIRKQANFW